MRQNSIANSPMAKMCESQMNKKNHLLPACRNVTQAANNLDQYHFKIMFNNMPDVLKNATYKLYNVARRWLYPYITENIYPPHPQENEIDITMNINEHSTALNVTMETPAMNVNLNNVRLNPMAQALLNVNPARTVIDSIGNAMSPLYYSREYIILSHHHHHHHHHHHLHRHAVTCLSPLPNRVLQSERCSASSINLQ